MSWFPDEDESGAWPGEQVEEEEARDEAVVRNHLTAKAKQAWLRNHPPPMANTIRWKDHIAWCRTHPGQVREIKGVYANAPYKLRRRAPGLEVTSTNYRFELRDGRRLRICDLQMVCPEDSPWAVYGDA